MSLCPASSLAESLTLVGWLERLFAMFAKQRRNHHGVGTPVALKLVWGSKSLPKEGTV